MKPKDLYMHTTKIDPKRTIREIHDYLARIGARRIMDTYENGEPIAVHFILPIGGQEVPFELPARVDPIYKIIHGNQTGQNQQRDLDQAKRTAWRLNLRWIQAQVALIETGMVAAGEVFMPYMQVGTNETLYQRALTQGFGRLALPERGGPEGVGRYGTDSESRL